MKKIVIAILLSAATAAIFSPILGVYIWNTSNSKHLYRTSATYDIVKTYTDRHAIKAIAK